MESRKTEIKENKQSIALLSFRAGFFLQR